jgi:hypothetical protein
MAEPENTERVTMIWPADLKEKVRLEVGKRGLTGFTVSAVQQSLDGGESNRLKIEGLETDLDEARELLEEARELAQGLADALVIHDDQQDPYATLRVLGVPAWLDQRGWANHVQVPRPVEPAPVIEPVVEPVIESEPVIEPVEPEPVLEPKSVAPANSLSPVSAHVSRSNPASLEERMAQARHLIKQREGEGVNRSVTGRDPVFESPVFVSPVKKVVCPKCKEELVAGECWTCSA